jgi:hypothetical protein
MTILRITTHIALFLTLASCSSRKISPEIPEGNPAYSDLISAESNSSLERGPASESVTNYTGQSTYRIVHYSAPDPTFKVDEDLTVLSEQDKSSLDAVAFASGVISASGGSLLKVKSKEDAAAGGEEISAVKQILGNIKRLSDQLKPYLGMVKPLHQIVYFVPMDRDNRDLYHGNDKLSTEPGPQSSLFGKQNFNTMGLYPLHPRFIDDVDRGIKSKLAEYTLDVKNKTAQPAQVLGFRTSVFYYPQNQKGTIAAEVLIALRSGETPTNVALGAGASLSSYNIPFDGQGRVTVAVITAPIGLGKNSTDDWGEMDVRFGEFNQFRGYTFGLKGEPTGSVSSLKTPSMAIAPPESSLDNNLVPRINVALTGKPDAKIYLGHVRIDLKKMKIRDLDGSVGLRWAPAISIDRIQNNAIMSVNVVDQLNTKIEPQVQTALNGGLDDVLNKILGGGAK